MYLLICACIREPEYRAVGITHERDIVAFEKAINRCREFDIPHRFLPCLETMYLGKDHPPGHFLERLNTNDFSLLMDQQEEEIREIFRREGPPSAIIGVDSSPVCGVNQTYYGSVDGNDPRIPGRGVFLKRFSEIPAWDVYSFSAYRIYLAAPLFTAAEREFNIRISSLLRAYGYQVHLPQDTGDCSASRGKESHKEIFSANLSAIESSDLIIAIIDGSDADSGTSWEMGYAFAKAIPVIAYRTDFRQVGSNELVNLMLEQSAVVVRTEDGLIHSLPCPVYLD